MLFYALKYLLLLLTALYATSQAYQQRQTGRDPRSDGEASTPSSQLRAAIHPVMFLVGIMSVLAIAVEVYKDVEEHKTQLSADKRNAALLNSLEQNIKKTETVLAEARRLAQPIKDVHVTFFITVPLHDPALSTYRARMDAVRAPFGRETTEPDTPAEFMPRTLVWPSLETEKLAHMLLTWVKIEMDIYKAPPSLEGYASLGRRGRPIPDLQMSTSAFIDPPNLRAWGLSPLISVGILHLRLGARPPRAELAAHGVPLSSRSATGKITAVADLVGCRLFLKLSHVAGVADAEMQKRANTIARDSTFSGITLDVPGSLMLSIPARSFQKHTDPSDGMPLYVFTFPATDEALRALQPR